LFFEAIINFIAYNIEKAICTLTSNQSTFKVAYIQALKPGRLIVNNNNRTIA